MDRTTGISVRETSGSCVGDVSRVYHGNETQLNQTQATSDLDASTVFEAPRANVDQTPMATHHMTQSSQPMSNLTFDTVRQSENGLTSGRWPGGRRPGPSGNGSHGEGPLGRDNGPAGVTPSTSANSFRDRFPRESQPPGQGFLHGLSNLVHGLPAAGVGRTSTPGQNNPYVPMGYRGESLGARRVTNPAFQTGPQLNQFPHKTTYRINPGDELFVDYGENYWEDQSAKKVRQLSSESMSRHLDELLLDVNLCGTVIDRLVILPIHIITGGVIL